MSLTVDVGNSRIKWAEWQAGEIIASGAGVYDKKDLPASLDAIFIDLKKPSVIYSVCVAAVEIRHGLTQWVKRHWQLDVDYLVTDKKFNNVTHGYTDPAEHGADRWAAIVAANHLYPETPLCVIGAGTAITIDFLKQDGQHLGGYILPSYVSMRAALTSDTANVVSMCSGLVMGDAVLNKGVPDNTSDAVNQGLHRLLQAGIHGFCKQAVRVLGGSVQVIVTGGFAETLLNYPGMFEMHHEPELVVQGLYIIKTAKA